MAPVSNGANSGPWQLEPPGAWCTVGAPSDWVSLVGLRPRRARFRFPSHLEV